MQKRANIKTFDTCAEPLKIRVSRRAKDCCKISAFLHPSGMIYGYARVSTDGQSVDAQVKALLAAGAEKIFRETASGAKMTARQLRRALVPIDADDMLMVARLDRLARSTRDLLNILAQIADRRRGLPLAGRRMGGYDNRARAIMLTVLGGLAEFERDLIRTRTGGDAPAPRRAAFTWGDPLP